jgi:hypothetical protein
VATKRAVEVNVIERRAVDEMVAKIQTTASMPGMAATVDVWRQEHAVDPSPTGFSFIVAGTSLMYLHRARDGTVIPHVCESDGRELVYTDITHAADAYG